MSDELEKLEKIALITEMVNGDDPTTDLKYFSTELLEKLQQFLRKEINIREEERLKQDKNIYKNPMEQFKEQQKNSTKTEKVISGNMDIIEDYIERIKEIIEKPNEFTDEELRKLANGSMFSFEYSLRTVRNRCIDKNIAYNEFDPKQEFTMKVMRNNSLTYHKGSLRYRRIDKEKPDTLKPIEYVDEEHRQAAQIAGKKIRELIDNLEVHFIDVTYPILEGILQESLRNQVSSTAK